MATLVFLAMSLAANSAPLAHPSGQGPGDVIAAPQPAVAARPPFTDAEIEQFLLKAKIIRTQGAGKGITGSIRATLSNGTVTHDAHIQTIDEYRREFRGRQTIEFDFRDSWMFNVAAYKIDRLIGLNMVPVSVPRTFRSNRAAITWWVDDVMMDEGTRLKKNMKAPEDKAVFWNREMQMLRLFDQLIANTDRNMQNILIGHDWRVWAIDHTRAFRTNKTLAPPERVARCDRAVLERLKRLDADILKREVGKYLDGGGIAALLARRDAIVDRLESLGPAALFDREVGS